MDSTSQKIIKLLLDNSDVYQGLKATEIEAHRSAQNIGASFAGIGTVISKSLVGFKKAVTITDDKGTTKPLRAAIEYETILQTVEGRYLKLTEVTGKLEGKNETLVTSMKDVTHQYDKTVNSQERLIGQSSKLATNFGNVTDVNQKFVQQLANTGKATFVIDENFQQIADGTQKFGYLVATSKGEILQLNEVISKTPDGVQNVSRSVTDVTDKFHNYSSSISQGSKNTVSLTENMARLAKRAVLTIPLWLVLRGAVMGTISTFRNGIKDIVDFDKALQKLQRNISATSQNIPADMQMAKDAIIDFSIQSGKSVEEIANAIQKFSTVGFSLEESLVGGLGATKLATLLFGDSVETADAFARSLRVMTENISNTEDKQRLMNSALALTDKLWKTNAFEVDEFSGNLQKIAGTASVANLSMNETLALLATLSTGGLAGRAGNLLRSTLLKSLTQMDKVAQNLGFSFDPKKQNTIEFVLLMVEALKKLKTQENVPAELADILGELFGAARGTELPSALTALEKTLKSNLAMTGDIANFNKEFEDQTKTINILSQRYTNLNKEIGRTFVSGLVGGEDFKNTLEKIVGVQEQLLKGSEVFGQILKDVFLVGGVTAVLAFQKQILGAIAALKSLMATAAATPIVLPVVIGGVGLLEIQNNLKKLAGQVGAKNIEIEKAGAKIGQAINRGFKHGLSLDELNNLIIELTTFGAVNLNMDIATFDAALKVLKEIRDVEAQTAKETEQSAISAKKHLDISKLVVANQIEKLKAQGALNSEILEATTLLNKQFGIKEDELTLLERQLEKERAINEEKRLQAKLGNESLELFKIAQEHGVKVAKEIGQVLAGEKDFADFIKRGGKSAEIFADKFSSIFESKQAEQFFKGEKISTLPSKKESGFDFNIFSKEIGKGLESLRGGFNIPILEEAIRGIDTSGANLELAKSIRDFERFETQNVQSDKVTIDRPSSVEIVGLANLPSTSPTIGNVRDTTSIDLIAQSAANRINQRLQGEKYVAPPPAEYYKSSPTTISEGITINFEQGSFQIHGGTIELQRKMTEELLRNLGTPGTKENGGLNKALYGSKQIR